MGAHFIDDMQPLLIFYMRTQQRYEQDTTADSRLQRYRFEKRYPLLIPESDVQVPPYLQPSTYHSLRSTEYFAIYYLKAGYPPSGPFCESSCPPSLNHVLTLFYFPPSLQPTANPTTRCVTRLPTHFVPPTLVPRRSMSWILSEN